MGGSNFNKGFKVEAIRGQRGTGKHTEYRVKWAGYAEGDPEGTAGSRGAGWNTLRRSSGTDRRPQHHHPVRVAAAGVPAHTVGSGSASNQSC